MVAVRGMPGAGAPAETALANRHRGEAALTPSREEPSHVFRLFSIKSALTCLVA